MASICKMYKITASTQQRMPIPSKFNDMESGKRPTALVAYTPLGARLMRLNDVAGSGFWEFSNEELGNLLTDMDMKEDEMVEFESHSNTELIVRAYSCSGREKYFGSEVPYMHLTTHFGVVLRSWDFTNSLDVNSTFKGLFTGLGPSPHTLTTVLGDFVVKGNAQASASSGFTLWGDDWRSFCSQHYLKEGMIMVFEHSGLRQMYRFNVWFYNGDGSECTHLCRRPVVMRQEEYSFYRRRSHKVFQEDYMELITKIFQSSSNIFSRKLLFTDIILLCTLAGNFEFHHTNSGPPHFKSIMRGDWDGVFEANSFGDNKVKFQLSLNNVSGERSVMFAVEFVVLNDGKNSPSSIYEPSGDDHGVDSGDDGNDGNDGDDQLEDYVGDGDDYAEYYDGEDDF